MARNPLQQGAKIEAGGVKEFHLRAKKEDPFPRKKVIHTGNNPRGFTGSAAKTQPLLFNVWGESRKCLRSQCCPANEGKNRYQIQRFQWRSYGTDEGNTSLESRPCRSLKGNTARRGTLSPRGIIQKGVRASPPPPPAAEFKAENAGLLASGGWTLEYNASFQGKK